MPPANNDKVVRNIGPRERRKRLIFGLGAFAIGFAFCALVISVGAPRLARLPVFLFFLGGAHGFFQYREKT